MREDEASREDGDWARSERRKHGGRESNAGEKEARRLSVCTEIESSGAVGGD